MQIITESRIVQWQNIIYIGKLELKVWPDFLFLFWRSALYGSYWPSYMWGLTLHSHSENILDRIISLRWEVILVYPHHFYWSACSKPGKWAVMYVCKGYRFCLCFYDLKKLYFGTVFSFCTAKIYRKKLLKFYNF